MKWRGWSSALEDLTWQSEEGLVKDGHAPLVLAYLLAEHRKGRHLTISDALRQAASQMARLRNDLVHLDIKPSNLPRRAYQLDGDDDA